MDVQDTQTEENVQLPTGAADPSEGAATEVAESKPEPIVVEGKEFASEAEAFAYLKASHREKDIELKLLAARQEGFETALANAPAGAAPQPTQAMQDDDEWDDNKYWENPAEYVKNYWAKKEKKLEQKFEARMTQVQTDAQIWNEFTARHPHLSGFKAEVEALASQYPDQIRLLARKDPNSAYDFVATKLTERFKTYASALAPSKELSNDGGGPSAGNSNRNVTPQQKTPKNDEAMDMASQIRSIRYR